MANFGLRGYVARCFLLLSLWQTSCSSSEFAGDDKQPVAKKAVASKTVVDSQIANKTNPSSVSQQPSSVNATPNMMNNNTAIQPNVNDRIAELNEARLNIGR